MLNDKLKLLSEQLIVSIFSSFGLFLVLQLLFVFFPVSNPWAVGSIAAFCTLFLQYAIEIWLALGNYRQERGRLEEIDLFIKTLTSGKLSARLTMDENGDWKAIEQSLNDLADKLDHQVKSLQRLVNVNAEMMGKVKNEAVTEERQRLARDLHDAVSQQLFALTMLASAAERSIQKNPELAAENIADVSNIARKAQGEMRALLLHLRPVRLSGETLARGLTRLIDELKGKTPMRFEADIQAIDCLSKGVENHLFRLCQEALSNALRHSEASVVKVSLARIDESVVLNIYDNGQGFDPTVDKISSYGLKTMRERAEEIGGFFTLATHAEEGTSLRIRVPIQREMT
ncbi:MAG: sensor histidine kinase [Sporolactobacillus sp.]